MLSWISTPRAIAASSLSKRVKRRTLVTVGAFGSRVSKEIPPVIRVCSDSLFTCTPLRLPVRVIPLEFQKRVEVFTRCAYSGSMCTPTTTRWRSRDSW
ncbi:Uncharacterised protein [Enterobacter cloacae]|nr:hypothetical protein PAERUG_E15_London_28_01_14_09457 [Pseudomonas aeruginosa]SAJ34680.1 Uncharacterised protein [Enterobacter cloacae]